MRLIEQLKPRSGRRTLLFMAACVWTFAGGMLLFRGVSYLARYRTFVLPEVVISVAAGILFYLLLFSKISLRHTQRIIDLRIADPCLFSFFNVKSYILMTVMISAGIIVRRAGVISPGYLPVLYITMGIPLFLSSLRFYYHGIFFNKDIPA